MHRFTLPAAAIAAVVVALLPFIGGAPSPSAVAGTGADERAGVAQRAQHEPATPRVATSTIAAERIRDSCPTAIGGTPNQAPGIWSQLGVGGTTSDDLALFALAFNQIRVANCLAPIPLANFTYNSCMEQRLFWMAEDPSTDPMSAWGHMGSQRSDGVPSVGCDGNLAGGFDDTGATVAEKWWESDQHRASLYRPGNDSTGACIAFAMSHGGIPNEPYPFTRAAARWYDC